MPGRTGPLPPEGPYRRGRWLVERSRASDTILTGSSLFDLGTAAKLARVAECSYAAPGVVERTALQQWHASWFRFLDVDGTQCLVAADDRQVVVCFRGTEADRPEDWISDLRFELVPGPLEGRVHAGFYDALARVWYLLDRDVRQLCSTGRRRLLVTGHSLGAALATLAVARWCEADVLVAGLYTFGQPRTGDKVFARHFDFAFRTLAFRIVNNLDVVTRTPPRSLGYRHLGTFLYLNDTGHLVDDIDWWRRFLNGWQGTIETILDWGREGVRDHAMAAYRDLLESAFRARHPAVPPTDLRVFGTARPSRPRVGTVPRRRSSVPVSLRRAS